MTEPAAPRPSGLRNPAGAVRGVAASALATQGLVLLLAVAPLARIGGPRRAAAIVLVLVLAVVALALIGLLRYRWVWWVGAAVPAGTLLGGVAHWSLGVLGFLFALLWTYVLRVRRTVMGLGRWKL